TVDDLHAFARMLLSGGRLPDGSRLLSRAAIDAMTTDQIDVASGAPGPLPDGSQGWGFGVGVQVRRTRLGPSIGSYGWAGGMGGRRRRARVGRAVLDLDGAHKRASARHAATRGVARRRALLLYRPRRAEGPQPARQ